MMRQEIKIIIYALYYEIVIFFAQYNIFRIHTWEIPYYCYLYIIYICNLIRIYIWVKSLQNIFALVSINKVIEIHTREKYSESNLCCVSLLYHDTTHNHINPTHHILCTTSFYMYSIYMHKVLDIFTQNYIFLIVLSIRYISDILVKTILNTFNNYIFVLRILFINYFIYGHQYQMELIYHYFTSPTKLYLIVCVGSECTINFYLVKHIVMLSLIQHNVFLSGRMGLLHPVNHTLLRWPLT